MAASNNTPKPVSVPTPKPASTPAPTPTPAATGTEAAFRVSVGYTAENVKPQTPHSSLLGANLEILKGLEKVNFIKGTDGAMTNSAAYLRIWTKNGSAPIGTEGGAVVPPTTANYSQLPVPAVANPPKPTATAQPAAKNSSGKGGDLKDYVPSPAVVNAFVAGATQPQTTVLDPAALKNMKAIGKAQGGTVKSANPKGFWNSLFRAGLRAVSVNEDGKVEYQSQLLNPSEYTKKGSGLDPVIDSSYDKGLWQFLFNPEEISVQGNAQYNAAEVWGVMDTNEGSDRQQNSGQPLQWRYNQNEKLVFSKILLNGYVFGRRVNTLEQGLTDLTKLAKSSNPDGPPVLDFVWGQRTFGPCVIRDFNIREKNWDDGVLVNAEISLTLERVPEWVINDGFVDVARPGRQALIDDPTTAVGATSAGQNKNDRDQEGNDKKPPTTQEEAAYRQRSDSLEVKKCQSLPDLIRKIEELKSIVEGYYPQNLIAGFAYRIDIDISNTYRREYEKIFNSAIALLGGPDGEFDRQFNGPNKGYRPIPLITLLIGTPAVTLSLKRIQTPRQILFLTAIKTVESALNNINKRKNCGQVLSRDRKLKDAKELNSRGMGSPCNDAILSVPPGKGWQNPVTKKNYVCLNGWLRIPRF